MMSSRHPRPGTDVAVAGVVAEPQRTPASSAQCIELRVLPEAAVVTVRGDVDIDLADALRASLAEAIACHRRVVLNLAEVAVIDSVGLGVLVRAHRDARCVGGALCLVAASRFILAVLQIMRLDVMFPLFDDCDKALVWLAGPSWPEGPSSSW